jgi:hypothetical protein
MCHAGALAPQFVLPAESGAVDHCRPGPQVLDRARPPPKARRCACRCDVRSPCRERRHDTLAYPLQTVCTQQERGCFGLQPCSCWARMKSTHMKLCNSSIDCVRHSRVHLATPILFTVSGINKHQKLHSDSHFIICRWSRAEADQDSRFIHRIT